ncbi:MAG TPA: rod shape-determining protein MreC [Rhizomicrobium sp.]
MAVLAVALILIGKAQSSLFDRARANVMDWMEPTLSASREPMVSFTRWVGSIGEIFAVYQQNLKLKEENARLRQWHNTAISLNERLKRYKLLLNAVPDPALSQVVARVIGRASHPFMQTLILDAGKSHGVKPGQAVVDSRGMIGRIFLTGERTSWVILLTDLNSRIPVTIEPGNAQAIMAGDNSPAPMIETLSRGTPLKVGDQVVTSGDGDILPAGLAIGSIAVVGNTYRVALFADETATQDVIILDFKQPPEQPPSPSPGDLPVTAAGLPPAASPPQQPAAASPTVKPSAAPPARSNVKPQTPTTQDATPAAPAGNPDNDVSDVGNE